MGCYSISEEMAADVAQKTDTRETSAMIIEGLGLGLTSSAVEIQEVGVEKPVEYCNQKAQNVVERPCQCSCNNNLESPDSNNIILDNVKEPVTAPF
ncbi:hypothetical protein PTKIN_Ptkin13bG0117300 [Pterospermum kingtungense]